MKFEEVRKDLFTVGEDYYLAHCVSSCLAMGAGIAVSMNAKFGLREALRASGKSLDHPTCVLTGRVFNMITKQMSCDKPLVGDFTASLYKMKELAVENGVKKIAMPRIGCGLDRLKWDGVCESIQKCFAKTDIEVLVCWQ